MGGEFRRRSGMRIVGALAAVCGGAAMAVGIMNFMSDAGALLPMGAVMTLVALVAGWANLRWLLLGLVGLPVYIVVRNVGWFAEGCTGKSACLDYSNPIGYGFLALVMLLVVIFWTRIGRSLHEELAHY